MCPCTCMCVSCALVWCLCVDSLGVWRVGWAVSPALTGLLSCDVLSCVKQICQRRSLFCTLQTQDHPGLPPTTEICFTTQSSMSFWCRHFPVLEGKKANVRFMANTASLPCNDQKFPVLLDFLSLVFANPSVCGEKSKWRQTNGSHICVFAQNDQMRSLGVR